MSPRKNVTYSSRPNHAARSAHAKGQKMFRTYDTSYIRPKRSPVPAIVGIVVLVVAIIAIIVGAVTFVRGCSSTPQLAPKGQEVQIVIEEGEGARSVAKTLVDAGLISSQNEFTDRLGQLGAENSLQPGAYTLVGGQSVDEIIAVLQTPVQVKTFTVPEGSTLEQTAEIVASASNNRIAASDFIEAASDASAYAGSYTFLEGAGSNSLEGFLFPKTYPIADDATADSIIRIMLDQFAIETAGLDFSYAESQGLSLYDVVNMASIIERETDDQDRDLVASVFYNRLDVGMMLQSDATSAYYLGHEPSPEELQQYDDYNTYLTYGLPPTPINSPGLGCLEAACSPAQTDYLYFYIAPDENGTVQHYFSETYEDHQASFA